MKKLKSQSGRSMVEMVGVLAIIGVLSVGGIAGYSLSMRRHRANGVVDILSKYALISYNNCQQKLLNGDVTNLSECSESGNGPNIIPYFSQSGLGDKPAGVNTITLYEITTDATSGVDTVVVSAAFDDDKLCQAVGSIAGTGCDESAHVVLLKIKQN